MLEQLESFSIGDQEVPLIPLDATDVRVGINKCRCNLIRCMLGGKEVNFTGFKAAMTKVWKCGSFDIQKLDEHFFQLFFGYDDIVEHIFSVGPWNFENHMIQLRAWDEKHQFTAVDMETENFLDTYNGPSSSMLYSGSWKEGRAILSWL